MRNAPRGEHDVGALYAQFERDLRVPTHPKTYEQVCRELRAGQLAMIKHRLVEEIAATPAPQEIVRALNGVVGELTSRAGLPRWQWKRELLGELSIEALAELRACIKEGKLP